MYYTYMVRCADDSLYTGWTVDIEKRLKAHNEGRGAKYTRARRPVVIAWVQSFPTKQLAMRWEWKIKHFTKEEKERLCTMKK
ncbi:GIY-YIG nuclease family protein [uncultured Megasphaera sp.]|uniref:GIY-YIG nuclease family protein n=1 Tax=uncultured Megasphaera sp. TaxID=165188 RepID=UPI002596637B|nr:GIY-YIG nuclease family protein [uncultured Megasphaera sp.]